MRKKKRMYLPDLKGTRELYDALESMQAGVRAMEDTQAKLVRNGTVDPRRIERDIAVFRAKASRLERALAEARKRI